MAVSAVNILFENKQGFTTNYYQSSAVYSSLSQNKFLSLPNKPSCSSKESNPVLVHVPFSIDDYVWEMIGYFKAKKTGKHTFSIDQTKLANIQVFSKVLKQQGFEDYTVDEYETILGEEAAFNEIPLTLHLVEDRYYKVKITFIAGLETVPIYVSEKTGFQKDLYSRVKGAMYDPSPKDRPSGFSLAKRGYSRSFYHTVGFLSKVFLLPKKVREYDYDYVLRDFSRLEKVHEGFFSSRGDEIQLPVMHAPVIREIVGHFRPKEDGDFRINLAGKRVASLQIGPRMQIKEMFLVVNEKWQILDTRSILSGNFIFEGNYFYPFRIVVLGTEDEFSLDVSVYDKQGREIDLLGLWNEPQPTFTRVIDPSKSVKKTISELGKPTLVMSENEACSCPDFSTVSNSATDSPSASQGSDSFSFGSSPLTSHTLHYSVSGDFSTSSIPLMMRQSELSVSEALKILPEITVSVNSAPLSNETSIQMKTLINDPKTLLGVSGLTGTIIPEKTALL
ncbi:hypothetical protein JCM33374_g2889 [Metschnikowia sp. JCM 33374]|nr:hypothetical protein JCM33374_g2889 [Metschnikowia sp. JCM 33374]